MTIGRPPYVLAHEGEVSLFQTPDALARYIEAPDLGGARAYDSEARVLTLTSAPVKRRLGFVNVPPVVVAVTDEIREDELREALRSYVVDRAGLPDHALGEESLIELMRRVSSIAEVTR
jgi:hypothetical protein